MKRLPLILSIVSLLAVAALYILFLTGKGKPVANDAQDVAAEQITGDGIKVMYINIDTVLNNYSMYVDLRDEWQKKYNLSDAELANKERKFQKELQEYQDKVQKGLLLRSEAQQIEQQLSVDQQNLLRLQESLRQELAEHDQVSTRKVVTSVIEYLDAVQAEYGYHYVLGTTFGSNIFYANQNLDITWKVINGLNEKYNNAKEKAK